MVGLGGRIDRQFRQRLRGRSGHRRGSDPVGPGPLRHRPVPGRADQCLQHDRRSRWSRREAAASALFWLALMASFLGRDARPFAASGAAPVNSSWASPSAMRRRRAAPVPRKSGAPSAGCCTACSGMPRKSPALRLHHIWRCSYFVRCPERAGYTQVVGGVFAVKKWGFLLRFAGIGIISSARRISALQQRNWMVSPFHPAVNGYV